MIYFNDNDNVDNDDTPDVDYAIEHPVGEIPEVRKAEGEPPRVQAEAIVSRSPAAKLWARNVRAVNVPLAACGITLLHFTVLLYKNADRNKADGRARRKFYAGIVEALLANGADPHALMLDRDGEMHTPAALCHGDQPPALRARMLAEAAAGRIDPDNRRNDGKYVEHRHRTRRDSPSRRGLAAAMGVAA